MRGGVHQRGQPAEMLDRRRHETLRVGRQRDVARDRHRAAAGVDHLVGNCLRALALDVSDHHACAFGGKPAHDRAADLTAAAGHQRDAILQNIALAHARLRPWPHSKRTFLEKS